MASEICKYNEEYTTYLRNTAYVHLKRKERRLDRSKQNGNELHNLCSSPDVVTVIEPNKMNWAEHAVLVG
jgi:hypothetical protein